MSVGETTPEERTERLLRRIEEVRKHYSKRFGGLDGPDDVKHFIFQLFHDATYLALHEGLDWQTISEEAAEYVLQTFPTPNA